MIGQNDNINLEVNDKKKIILGFYGLFYVVILIIIVIVGYSYLGNIESFSKNSLIPPSPFGDTVKGVSDLQTVKGTVTAPVDLAKEVISTPEKIDAGKKLFETNCVSCHGTEGKGDGVAGKTLNPPPRNFTDAKGWTNGQEFSKMYKTLQEGITSRGMASYNNLLPEDRINLILYIRTFRNDFPAIDKKEITDVDNAYSLSKGLKLPSQIPVKQAVEIMLEEKKQAEAKIENIVKVIKEGGNLKGAEIFNRISVDTKRSVTALSSYTRWNENESQFVKFVSLNPETKGFKASLSSVTSEEWSILFNYLKSVFSV
ncbi:MAG: cytochrome c [Ignavibacteria bacterium]|nr:cytochrome c [Ignavibacteria bacterium]